jgi:hypothetical protein
MQAQAKENYAIDKSKHDLKTEYFLNEVTSENKYHLLCITIVFKSSSTTSSEDRWLNYYKNAVLGKFRRKLASGKKKRNDILLIDDLTQYEYDICSKYKSSIKINKYVHHIHGFLPIPLEYVSRIIDESGSINIQLLKDIASMNEVADVYIERTREGKADMWLSYMTKGKHFSNYSWNK